MTSTGSTFANAAVRRITGLALAAVLLVAATAGCAVPAASPATLGPGPASPGTAAAGQRIVLRFDEAGGDGGPAARGRTDHRQVPVNRSWQRRTDPGKVFDLTLPSEQAADGYTAMDELRAIKVLLRP